MSQFLASFDNREIAALFWLSAALIAAALHPKIRASMVRVLRAFFVLPILVGVLLLVAYFGCVVLLFAQIGIWAPSQLKLTLLWLGTAGFLGLFSAPKVSEDPDLISKAAKEIFQLTVVFEFFVNLYRMPLVAEIVFVPLLVLLGALIAVSELDKAQRSVNRLLTGFAVVIGFVFLAYAAWKTISDPASVATFETARSFILPIVYSLLLLPFVWAVAVYIAYESIFIRLKFVAKDESLHPYIKRSLILRFRGNIRYLRAWFQAAWFRTFATRKDVDDSIRSMLDGVSAV
ncbi:hypothetical protein [Halomonas sp. Mc5H-6]|uniref:hypothetical protein n=1 Tax=Halomonas sp. Mc5H-6 TaxID=2954500 RepID=UPI002097CD16|nr:hypothetical protein [Halomonas sp. Mc5H-6]MCO7247741.1 hypothetical protein [Halomonas sp. Mc5H-6]